MRPLDLVLSVLNTCISVELILTGLTHGHARRKGHEERRRLLGPRYKVSERRLQYFVLPFSFSDIDCTTEFIYLESAATVCVKFISRAC